MEGFQAHLSQLVHELCATAVMGQGPTLKLHIPHSHHSLLFVAPFSLPERRSWTTRPCSWRGVAKCEGQHIATIGRASDSGAAVCLQPICMGSTQNCAYVGDRALPVLVLLNIFTRSPEA